MTDLTSPVTCSSSCVFPYHCFYSCLRSLLSSSDSTCSSPPLSLILLFFYFPQRSTNLYFHSPFSFHSVLHLFPAFTSFSFCLRSIFNSLSFSPQNLSTSLSLPLSLTFLLFVFLLSIFHSCQRLLHFYHSPLLLTFGFACSLLLNRIAYLVISFNFIFRCLSLNLFFSSGRCLTHFCFIFTSIFFFYFLFTFYFFKTSTFFISFPSAFFSLYLFLLPSISFCYFLWFPLTFSDFPPPLRSLDLCLLVFLLLSIYFTGILFYFSLSSFLLNSFNLFSSFSSSSSLPRPHVSFLSFYFQFPALANHHQYVSSRCLRPFPLSQPCTFPSRSITLGINQRRFPPVSRRLL